MGIELSGATLRRTASEIAEAVGGGRLIEELASGQRPLGFAATSWYDAGSVGTRMGVFREKLVFTPGTGMNTRVNGLFFAVDSVGKPLKMDHVTSGIEQAIEAAKSLRVSMPWGESKAASAGIVELSDGSHLVGALRQSSPNGTSNIDNMLRDFDRQGVLVQSGIGDAFKAVVSVPPQSKIHYAMF